MSNTQKWLSGIIVIILMVFVGLFSCREWVFHLIASQWDHYYQYSGKPMLEYISDRHQIQFPPDNQNIRAAKTLTSWEGWSDFVLSFQTSPKMAREFIDSFPRPLQVRPLKLGEDTFFKYAGDPMIETSDDLPDWVPRKIPKGEIGTISLPTRKDPNTSFPITVMIETINDTTCIVYHKGNYKASGQ